MTAFERGCRFPLLASAAADARGVSVTPPSPLVLAPFDGVVGPIIGESTSEGISVRGFSFVGGKSDVSAGAFL